MFVNFIICAYCILMSVSVAVISLLAMSISFLRSRINFLSFYSFICKFHHLRLLYFDAYFTFSFIAVVVVNFLLFTIAHRDWFLIVRKLILVNFWYYVYAVCSLILVLLNNSGNSMIVIALIACPVHFLFVYNVVLQSCIIF